MLSLVQPLSDAPKPVGGPRPHGGTAGPWQGPHVLVDARFSATPRGGDRCRLELARGLAAERRLACTFLTYPHGPAAIGVSANGSHATLVTDVRPHQHPRADLFEHLFLPLRGRRVAADLYHGTFQVLPLLPAAPVNVVTIHDMAVFAFPQAYSSKFAAYMRFLITRSARQADRIIAISEATRREIVRFLPDVRSKITCIPNGVGAEFVAARRIDAGIVTSLRRHLGIAGPYILFVGNLEPKKNLVRLVAAFARLREERCYDGELVIVGSKPEKLPDCGLTPQADGRYPGVVFTGYLPDDDLPVLYRGADLVAYPSLYEGFGMPVLEGMACGVPVLTSNCSSLPEVAGGAAMLVDPRDVDDIARGLRRGLSDQGWRQEAVEHGIERANELTWESNARQTANLYIELCARRPKRGRSLGS